MSDCVVISFRNGTKKYIKGVTDYEINGYNRYVIVIKNHCRQFFNFDEILYVGRKVDLEDDENDLNI